MKIKKDKLGIFRTPHDFLLRLDYCNKHLKKILKLIMCFFILFISACQENIYLVAKEKIYIYRTINEAMDAAAQKRPIPINFLEKGEKIFVSDCHDRKSRFVVEVKLEDGRSGYIGPGPFYLTGTPPCL